MDFALALREKLESINQECFNQFVLRVGKYTELLRSTKSAFLTNDVKLKTVQSHNPRKPREKSRDLNNLVFGSHLIG